MADISRVMPNVKQISFLCLK